MTYGLIRQGNSYHLVFPILEHEPAAVKELLCSGASPVECSRHGGTCFNISAEFLARIEAAYELFNRKEQAALRKFRREAQTYEHCGGLCTPSDLREIWNIQRGRCYYSGLELSKAPKNYHIDHLIPVSKNGSFWPDNLVLAHSAVNLKKSDCDASYFIEDVRSEHDAKWVSQHRRELNRQDKERAQLAAKRRAHVIARLAALEGRLLGDLPDFDIELALHADRIHMYVNGADIYFAPGLIRVHRAMRSHEYFKSVALRMALAT